MRQWAARSFDFRFVATYPNRTRFYRLTYFYQESGRLSRPKMGETAQASN